MKVLFVCNQNLNRSKTAEELFKNQFETKSGGLYNEKPITKKQVAWADTLVVMEEEQRIELVKRFPELCLKKRVLSFDISDAYHYNQLELIDVLKHKASELL
jgi:predicted protein tyrosine phosphatase